jgi:hypothetical protein
VRDDVPSLAAELTKHEVDIASAGNRAKCFENDLGVGLEDDDRFVEERESGVPSGGGADCVALLDEIVRRRSRERARPVTHIDLTLENCEARARRNHRASTHKNAGPGCDQQECRRHRRGERERMTASPMLGQRRHGDKRYERGRMRVMDGIANFGQRRGDDLELDLSEHVLGFALGRVVQRIGHREGRARASELDEGDGAELAEATRQLAHDGGLGCDAKRDDRTAADASERFCERIRRHEP